MKLERILLLTAFTLFLIMLYTVWAKASPSCPTLREARAEHRNAHLWKHKGCWGLRNERRRERRQIDSQPIEKHLTNIAIADANGAEALAQEPLPNEPLPIDAFTSQQEPIRTFMVPEYAKKSDRLDVKSIPDPMPEEAPLPKQITDWRPLIAGALAAVTVSLILTLTRLPFWLATTRRKTNDRTRSAAARPDNRIETRRERPPAGSDGPRNQQSYFYPWEFSRWRWRTDVRGHAVHPDPAANSRDDFTAIGAWARARGFRAEESRASDADQPESVGGLRKRFAIFARR